MASKVIEFNPAMPPELAKDSDGNATTKGEAYTFDVPSIVTSPIKVTAPDDSYFSWQPAELCYKDESGQIDYIVGSSPSAINIFKNQAKYSRTFPLSDDIFNAEADRVKHWTILNEKPRDPAEYMTGKLVFGVSGLITGIPLPPGVHESIQSGMFNLPKPIIKDLTGKEIDGYYEVIDMDNSQKLFIWFDADFLYDAVYPVTIDPTVILSGAISYNSSAGRAILRIPSNNWLITMVFNNGTIYIYKSLDNGSTWSQLCTISGAGNVILAMTNIGNKATVLFSMNYAVYSVTFDATTVSNTDLNSTKVTLYSSFYDTNIEGSITNDGTNLYATVRAKISGYTNAFNIFYWKSTNGGQGWSGYTQITTDNLTGFNYGIPTILIKSDGYPIILTNYCYYSTFYIYALNYNGSSWSKVTAYSNSINLYNPGSGLVKKYSNAGYIYYVFPEYINGTNWNISYVYSTNNGVSWSHGTITNKTGSDHARTPVISEKLNGDLVFMYAINDVHIAYNLNGVETLITGTTYSDDYPNIMDYQSNGIIGYAFWDSKGVYFDKFSYNQAPNAPILASKSNFVATKVQTLSWTFSDSDPGNSQSAYELIIIRVSDGVTIRNTGKVVSTSSNYNLPANTLTNGNDYQWKVKTWDNSDAEGPYSSLGTFTCAAAPTATLTSPSSDGNTITTSKITAGWNFNDSESGRTQSKYQVRLTDSSDNELWNSGQVSDANARALTCNYTLANNTSYKLKITVWNDLGIQSDEAVRTFTVSFTPPATPTITAIADNDMCSITVNITNPEPSGSEPTVSGNDIYRDGIRIAANVNSQYVDYAAEPFIQHTYKAISLGDNGTVSESSVLKVSTSITDVLLMLVSNPSQYVKLKYNPSKEEKAGPAGELMQFAGRKLPVAEFDDSDNQNINCSFTILDKPDLDMLLQLADSKQTLLYRDSRGRKIYCTINDGISTKDELPDYWTVSFTINAISYDEEV